jgi:hypothetical protein
VEEEVRPDPCSGREWTGVISRTAKTMRRRRRRRERGGGHTVVAVFFLPLRVGGGAAMVWVVASSLALAGRDI